ncbi:carbohydrate-binding module family 50 protein [Macrolepiota fuliginosa MF-IS2]|uniref:Carbohydrate-binding module family 50 protein n=1 Tax=Macrolepiota fuliginosa MF-IS2 TaxID=1400762 RepID=A0A9P5XFT1_9AGAR|nr:carbohydrate-binding module family 50 protein [Macrolepiota fuliginosa MF-IS2]
MFSLQAFSSLFMVALLGTVGHAQNTTCTRQYTVQSGDFCDGISAAQNVSTFQLAHVNAATINPICTNLFAGETLCLGIAGQDCDTVHVVASGDNCEAIAATAGTDFATLVANNPNVDAGCTNIYPGEVLCTATELIPYNTTSSS